MICRECGAHIGDGDRFCLRCGKKCDVEVVPVCRRCGLSYPPGSIFCARDGELLVTDLREPACSAETDVGAQKGEGDRSARMRPVEDQSGGAKRKRGNVWALILAATIVVSGCTVLFLFRLDFFARPENVMQTVNAGLRVKGLAVTVQVDGSWTATATGTVRDENEKNLALGEIGRHREIRRTVDKIRVNNGPVDGGNIRRSLSQVIESLVQVKDAVNDYFLRNRRIDPALDGDAIQVRYGIRSLNRHASFKVDERGAVTATIRDVSPDVDGKSISVSPDDDFRTWLWSSTIGQAFLPSTVLISSDRPAEPSADRGAGKEAN